MRQRGGRFFADDACYGRQHQRHFFQDDNVVRTDIVKVVFLSDDAQCAYRFPPVQRQIRKILYQAFLGYEGDFALRGNGFLPQGIGFVTQRGEETVFQTTFCQFQQFGRDFVAFPKFVNVFLCAVLPADGAEQEAAVRAAVLFEQFFAHRHRLQNLGEIVFVQTVFRRVDVIGAVVVFAVDKEENVRDFVFAVLFVNARKQVEIGTAADGGQRGRLRFDRRGGLAFVRLKIRRLARGRCGGIYGCGVGLAGGEQQKQGKAGGGFHDVGYGKKRIVARKGRLKIKPDSFAGLYC